MRLDFSMPNPMTPPRYDFMEHKITMTGQYQTRDGRPARVLCVDAAGVYPVVALVKPRGDSVEYPVSFSADGFFWCGGQTPSQQDLIPVPAKFCATRWFNVYLGPGNILVDGGFVNRSLADGQQKTASCYRRIACVEITIEGCEGDGL